MLQRGRNYSHNNDGNMTEIFVIGTIFYMEVHFDASV